MMYRGHIRKGVAVPDESVELPDGTPVRIEVEQTDSDFRAEKTVADLGRAQGVEPVDSFDKLVIEWPDEDSIEELLALVREVRR